MGFLKQEPRLTSQMMVGITEMGKNTAQQLLAKGPTFAVLSTLNDHSPLSIKDISEETQIDITELKERIRILARQGYVRLTGGSGY